MYMQAEKESVFLQEKEQAGLTKKMNTILHLNKKQGNEKRSILSNKKQYINLHK